MGAKLIFPANLLRAPAEILDMSKVLALDEFMGAEGRKSRSNAATHLQFGALMTRCKEPIAQNGSKPPLREGGAGALVINPCSRQIVRTARGAKP
jgi:hypothetical protein